MQNSSTATATSIAALNASFALDDRRRRDRVWKGSRRSAKVFAPMTRAERDRLWHRAKQFFRFDGDRFAKWILHALLFDFLNMRDGRLDPSWDAIARAAQCSVSTVYRRLKRLQRLGLLSWQNYCSGAMVDGRYQLEQDTNAYCINAVWREAIAPTPHPESLGAHPPQPGGLALAADARTDKERQRALDLDPDPLSQAVARLHALKPRI